MASQFRTYNQQKLQGQIYTSDWIVEKILDNIEFNNTKILGKRILDPACGDGQFLVEIVKRIIGLSETKDLKENLSYVHGWDIDPNAVSECKRKLDSICNPLNLSVNWNLKVINSIEQLSYCKDKALEQKFDYIVGNPPYIRIQNLEQSSRSFIRENYDFCKKGNTDLYVAFFELALNLLSTDGIAAYITPNSYFSTITGLKLRETLVSKKSLIKISNYGSIQLFRNATTYSAITIFGLKPRTSFIYEEAYSKYDLLSTEIPIDRLTGCKTWALPCSALVNEPGIKLKDISKIQVGITTLCDKAFIFEIKQLHSTYSTVATKLGGTVKIESAILRPIIKASKYKNSSQELTEHILFPYEKIGSDYKIIPEDKLAKLFPAAYNYLLSIKPVLDKRDNGKPNKVAWYAYGRNQGINIMNGSKIIFSPMNRYPNFVISHHTDALFYSGYCILYDGNIEHLAKQLNSDRMFEFISASSRDLRGGWKAYNKSIVEEFTMLPS
ncbi:class I SAM-dependent DNA methyltransferase [Dyadobacter sp. Leaf189]|uniref:HsdM family class I SAM-dependent methyltransferase n=1 Tax=Dyadobacter sp. Leaf189 TaxID=1736295 RepID=UPI0006F7A6F3|nr:N-6 DNA methylase [Dyadobacter sp. Leaf189]KQS27984.1 hypothetical protein ASG33_16440 [Dyadobacter sp. Leaf189]